MLQKKRPKTKPRDNNLGKWKAGEGEGEGNYLFKTHKDWNFYFTMKEK